MTKKKTNKKPQKRQDRVAPKIDFLMCPECGCAGAGEGFDSARAKFLEKHLNSGRCKARLHGVSPEDYGRFATKNTQFQDEAEKAIRETMMKALEQGTPVGTTKECAEHLTDAMRYVEGPQKTAERVDRVNHPGHYNRGKIEVIEFLEDQKLDFHLANAVKYISRSEHKGNEIEDLEKAIWYLRRKIELKKGSSRRPNEMPQERV